MEMTKSTPILRVRVLHDQTQRGWRLKETTVEIEVARGDDMDWKIWLPGVLENAYAYGTDEANRRNAVEGREP
jgi:hypothetical protein